MGNSRTKARRSGKGRSPQTKWSYEEEYTLFSWLDFTIFSLKKPDIDFFHETVINRLKNRWTLHQIERRLKKRWDDLGPDRPRGYSWKQDIYHSGSSTLNLEPIHREAISKAFQLLGDERIAIQLATPDRGLRSRSSVNKRPSGSLLSKSLLRSMSLGLSPTPVPDYMPRRQKRIGCQSPKEEACIPESSPSGYSVGTLKRKRSTEIPSSESNYVVLVPNHRLEKQSPRTRSPTKEPSLTINDTEDDDIYWAHNNELISVSNVEEDTEVVTDNIRSPAYRSSIQRAFTKNSVATQTVDMISVEPIVRCTDCSAGRSVKNVQYICDKRAFARHPSPPVVPFIPPVVDPRLGSAISEIQTLQIQIQQLEKEQQEHEFDLTVKDRKISDLKVARDLRDTASMEEQITKNRLSLEKYRSEAVHRKDFERFINIGLLDNERLGMRDVEQCFKEMWSHARQILNNFDEEELPQKPSLKVDDELKSWIHGIFGLERSRELGNEGVMCEISKLTAQSLIRSLICSAIQSWVFEADFPRSYLEPLESSSLLNAYRETALAHGGLRGLQALHLASLSMLTSPKSTLVTDTILKVAKDLSIRLSQTLAPFFTPLPITADNLTWDGFATWGNPPDIYIPRQSRMCQMFTLALEVKARTMCNLENYRMVTWKQGDSLQCCRARMETRDGAPIMIDIDGKEAEVELCVEGTLVSRPRVVAVDGDVNDVVGMKWSWESREPEVVRGRENRIGDDERVLVEGAIVYDRDAML